MLRASLFAIAALAAIGFTVAKVKITPAYEAGQKTKWKTMLKMDVGGTLAEISGTIVTTVKSVEGDKVNAALDWENGKAVVGGEEMPVPFAATTYVLNKAGELQEAAGGIQGTDPSRQLLVTFAHLPNAELEKDGKWTATYPSNSKMELGERKVEGTYLGEEEVGGKKTHKFKTTLKEGDFSSTLTYWVTEAGLTLKLEGEFDGLPIPVAGANAKGTVTGEYVP